MSLLAIVPARGGSKGIPRKNIKDFCGKPLIAWTVETAQKVNLIDKLILSTDSHEIATVGRNLGIEVPFLRPAELADDTTPGVDVVLHALDHFQTILRCFYSNQPHLCEKHMIYRKSSKLLEIHIRRQLFQFPK